jgi:hypothetical protein
LCEALFHGYPYITHIRNDGDLQNLFRDRNRLRAIEAVYNAGSRNNFIGKYFDSDVSEGYIEYIYFKNENIIDICIKHGDSRYDSTTYEIKNYIVTFSYIKDIILYVKQFEGSDRYGINLKEITSSEFFKK